MKLKRWIQCAMVASLVAVGGMANAEKLVFSDGLSLDLGPNTYVVSAKDTYFGKKFSKAVDSDKMFTSLFDEKEALDEIQKQKGAVPLLPDAEKNKAYLKTMSDIFKSASFHQVSYKEGDTWYQAMVMEGLVTKEQLTNWISYHKELLAFNISKLEKEKANPKTIETLKANLDKLNRDFQKDKPVTVEQMNKIMQTIANLKMGDDAWESKEVMISEKKGIVGNSKDPYVLTESKDTFSNGHMFLPLYVKALMVEKKEGYFGVSFVMDQPSGKRISKIIDKAMKGAHYEK